MDIVNFIWVTVLFGFIMYFIANFMIKKFNYATPGRNGNYENADGSSESSAAGETKVAEASQAVNIINLLGGRANIVDVDACMTRLRVTVKMQKKLEQKNNGNLKELWGLVMKGQGVQAYLWT